jgi:hypothetical protein
MKRIISSLLISMSIASCGYSPLQAPVTTMDNSGSYVINVGQKQNGATISAKINVSNLFKTKAVDASVDGVREKRISDIRYINVYLLALDDSYAGSDPLGADMTAIPNVSTHLNFSHNADLGDNFGVKFTNVGETPTGKKYYIGVVAKDSANNVISKDGFDWTGVSDNSGLNLSSSSVSVDNMFVVTPATPLSISLDLKDAVGAEVAANINPQDGLGQSYSTDMLGFSTVAGGGVDVFGASNVVATDNALTANMRGIAADGSGNVYFADEAQGYIAMVNKSSMLSIVATGLDTPVGLAVNENGDIYVIENGATKKVTKFAKQSLGVYTKSSYSITSGSPLTDAYSVAFSKVNPNIVYIGAVPNVIKLDTSTGMFTDLIMGFGDTAGIGVDTSDNLYISEFTTGKLVQYNPDTNTSVDIATGLTSPDGVVVDYSGNIYVAVEGNKINKYTYNSLSSSWTPSLFAGGGAMAGNTNGALRTDASIDSIEMLAIEAGKNLSGDPTLYYVDQSAQLVRKIVP